MEASIKTLNCKIRELNAGDVFGLEELLLSSVSRCCQAIAANDCELEYIDKEQFLQCKASVLICDSVQLR